ncbi:hypothetical protein N9L47_01770 [Rhodobacteraceae bacterium]|nr:hypothetical protein [Paracoccaceae bacterium]
MAHFQKIATCCYCRTRAALTLAGREQHELACSNCGAPLHDMKMLKAPEPVRSKPERSFAPRPGKKCKYRKNKKRTKSLSQRFLSEVWDVADDLFDDLFDIFD